MTTVYDVHGQNLVFNLAEALKNLESITIPDWSVSAKTAAHKENAPDTDDWWYMRSASILRKIYLEGPLGTERLARMYSGAKDRGGKPNRSHPGGRKIIRTVMKQLEAAELITYEKGKGRKISPRGQSMLDGIALEVKNKKG